MAKAESVLLAHTYNERKHGIGGWFMSQKLDGMRAWWDGGVSRGMPASDVPYANTAKDSRYVNQLLATGLWTRYMKPIQAPNWFLDQLPDFCLDGELYLGIGRTQELNSIVKQLIPDDRWRDVRYMVFDCPHPSFLFQDRELFSRTDYRMTISGALDWWSSHRVASHPMCSTYEQVNRFLGSKISENAIPHKQEQLPFNTQQANARLSDYLAEICDMGGEGVMLRKHVSLWTPERSYNLLKVKKLQDAEGVVIGYRWGERTDKGSKHLGRMGSLRLAYNGREFDLSGFNDDERKMIDIEGWNGFENVDSAIEEGERHPGELAKFGFINPSFPLGSTVTFKFRDYTDDGIPKEARYWRKRID